MDLLALDKVITFIPKLFKKELDTFYSFSLKSINAANNEQR